MKSPSLRTKFLTKTCSECNGIGQIEQERERRASFSVPYGFIDTYWEVCPKCEGNGELCKPAIVFDFNH